MQITNYKKFVVSHLLRKCHCFILGLALAGCETIPSSSSQATEQIDAGNLDISDSPLGRLDWGTNPKSGRPWLARDLQKALGESVASDLSASLREVLEEARDGLELTFQPVATIEMAGLLDSDPRMKVSATAVSELRHLPALALCSRIGRSDAAEACRKKAIAAINSWTKTNVPSGNPINDSKLVPLIQSIDLIRDSMGASDQNAATAWVRKVIERGDAYYASRPPLPKGKPTGNYMSWHLGVRALSAVVVGDQALVKDTADRLDKHLAVNIYDDGSSYDFRARDALHYHLYDLQPLILTALFAPAALSDAAKARLKKGVDFLKPFYTRQQTHIEFQNSKSLFDKTRRGAGQGEYGVANWDPAKASICLFRSRLIFPDIRSWTSDASRGVRSPVEKAIYALKFKS